MGFVECTFQVHSREAGVKFSCRTSLSNRSYAIVSLNGSFFIGHNVNSRTLTLFHGTLSLFTLWILFLGSLILLFASSFDRIDTIFLAYAFAAFCTLLPLLILQNLLRSSLLQQARGSTHLLPGFAACRGLDLPNIRSVGILFYIFCFFFKYLIQVNLKHLKLSLLGTLIRIYSAVIPSTNWFAGQTFSLVTHRASVLSVSFTFFFILFVTFHSF